MRMSSYCKSNLKKSFATVLNKQADYVLSEFTVAQSIQYKSDPWVIYHVTNLNH